MTRLALLLCVALLVAPVSWDVYAVYLLLPAAVLWRGGYRWSVLGLVALLMAQHEGPRLVSWGVPPAAIVFQPAAYIVAAVLLWRIHEPDAGH